MELYFVRHGQTDQNVKMDGNPADDVSLNQLGEQQAKDLAVELKDVKIDAIISSILNRAKQTAELINEYHQLPIKLDPTWRERDLQSYLALDVWHDAFDFDKNIQLENSESLVDFFDRIYAALDRLKQDYPGKAVLVVSHGGVQNCVYAYANKLPLSGNMRTNPMKNCELRIYKL